MRLAHADILPSVRQRGVLQTLIVREKVKDGAPDPDDIEVIAGARRYYAARAVVEEGGAVDPLPVAIMEPGDDAAAIEASLIENFARLDPDEVTQWRTFTRLLTDGNLAEKVKVQKRIIRDHLDGVNGRSKSPNWTPAWLRFPIAGYTDRPFATRDKWTRVAPLFAQAADARAQQPIAAE